MSTTTNTDQLARECAEKIDTALYRHKWGKPTETIASIIADIFRPLVEERDHWQSEAMEQARLLGISGSVEAQLRAEVQRLKQLKQAIADAAKIEADQLRAAVRGADALLHGYLIAARRDNAEPINHDRAIEHVSKMNAALETAEGALKDVIDFCDNARIWHRADQAIALLRELQDVRKAAGPGEPLSGVVATLRDERDRLLEALHACFALTGEDAGDLDDFRALQHREQAVIEAVRTLRKNHDEIADRLWKALTP